MMPCYNAANSHRAYTHHDTRAPTFVLNRRHLADDFDGQLYNATNLALKGVAAIAAYGYIAEKYTGDPA